MSGRRPISSASSTCPTPPMGLYSEEAPAWEHADQARLDGRGAERSGQSAARAVGASRPRPDRDPRQQAGRRHRARRDQESRRHQARFRSKPRRRRARSTTSTLPPSRAISRSSAGLKLTNAFALEKMTTPYINVLAVKTANAKAEWAQDIVAGYKSPGVQDRDPVGPVLRRVHAARLL